MRRHSDRVARLAEVLGSQVRWPSGDIAQLKEAAALHDVGKLGIPDAILLKPGRLTPEEYEQVKQHSRAGADLVYDVLNPTQVEWILHHHERPDGRGYPHGLREADLTPGAALLALADAWDVMTVDRPYQAAMTVSEALTECRALLGSSSPSRRSAPWRPSSPAACSRTTRSRRASRRPDGAVRPGLTSGAGRSGGRDPHSGGICR